MRDVTPKAKHPTRHDHRCRSGPSGAPPQAPDNTDMNKSANPPADNAPASK